MTEENKLDQWHQWNSQGFIPGPEENETQFSDRVAFCQNLEQHLLHQTKTDFPLKKCDEKSDTHSKQILEEALPTAMDLYGISPRWVPLFFSNHQLSPWHGGCAWIFQLSEEVPISAFLQLRSGFRQSLRYLGLYDRKELIVHELCHVGRMAYHEPQFEEMLAYQSSGASWRRWLGPIVQSSTESLVFVLLLGLVVLTDIALLSVGAETSSAAFWIKSAPIVLILTALARLCYRHYCLNRCMRHLEQVYTPKTARHLLYRLRDHEIKYLGKLPPSDIHEWMEKSASGSFRWLFLKSVYQNSSSQTIDATKHSDPVRQ